MQYVHNLFQCLTSCKETVTVVNLRGDALKLISQVATSANRGLN